MSYVKQVSRWRKFLENATRVLRIQKVFKKKSCGALPDNGKDFILPSSTIEYMTSYHHLHAARIQ